MGFLRYFLLVLSYALAVAASGQSYPDYKGRPWVVNSSRPTTFPRGLEGRHIALWASHGRYYDIGKATWKWQRPYTFCTTEDLLTQSVVNPFLIPMLQNAGAVVFTPRERDWQKEEVVVDNDTKGSGYYELEGKYHWATLPESGFAFHRGSYTDGENPFQAGTARGVRTTKKDKKASYIVWQPWMAEEGRHAVYVSYQTLDNSIDDAEYRVYHRGACTVLHVNQQMGGGTWVYLGTFDFGKGSSQLNCVVLTNRSARRGFVTADAVRFGGGMGNIERGGQTSGVPRYLEGARYWVQWAGAPYSVYSHSGGTNDYNDDINSRSQMLNWIGGGSDYISGDSGKHVPIELSIALHTDAGYNHDGYIGTLGICTTGLGKQDILDIDGGRRYSQQLAATVQQGLVDDISRTIPQWPSRGVWDRNYSETRRPDVPSTIVEALAHQNFNDMRLAHDPNFKFLLARSIYHSILKYLSGAHGYSAVVAPLQPASFAVEVKGKYATLSWLPARDTLYYSTTDRYIIYTAMGNAGYDNGTLVDNTQTKIELEPGVLYRFRVSAVNSGGESFKTEELVAMRSEKPRRNVMIVNGFTRLAGPQVVATDTTHGFDIDADPGVSYGPTTNYSGRQLCFGDSTGGQEGPGALGYSGSELEGAVIAGNNFNYPAIHADAMAKLTDCSISSSSAEAVERERVDLNSFNVVDLILGCQRRDGYSLVDRQTIPPSLQSCLQRYHNSGGNMMVSGAYVGLDMTSSADHQFMLNTLGVERSDTAASAATARGLGLTFNLHHQLNPQQVVATRLSRLHHAPQSFCAMLYPDGTPAAVAQKQQRGRTFVMGFPFEAISDRAMRSGIMGGIMRFLTD